MLEDLCNIANYGGMTVVCPFCGSTHKLIGKKLENIFTENGYTMYICNCGYFIVLGAVPIHDYSILKGDKPNE